MISIEEHVVVIFSGWQEPKKYCVQDNSSPQSLKIVWRQLRSVTLIKCLLRKCVCIQLLSTLLSALAHLQSGGIDLTCHPSLVKGCKYIIIVIDYFTKWVEAMPTFSNDRETMNLFMFNQVIAKFEVPREIITNHGTHFQQSMMMKLLVKLGFKYEHSSHYYPRPKVEVINKKFKTMLQRIVDKIDRVVT